MHSMIIDGDKLKVFNARIARRKLGSATAEDVTLLEIALAVETAARISGDANLQAQITAEVAARIAGDAALQLQITAEIAARAAADVVLQNQITELQQPRYSTSLLLSGM